MGGIPFKYDADVDLSNRESSHSLLVELTGPSKLVLDVGCHTGYLGKALVGQGCRVVGIEADVGAAAVAARAYEAVFAVNLDETDLAALLPGASFDVILFGDVLEHLKDPPRTLRQATALLARDGYVLASMPNIAHASVALALLRGEFQYQERGLLDSTHLRFFTLHSIETLLAQSGYRLDRVRRMQKDIHQTEIPVHPEDFPEAVVAFALQHPEARTYQFVVQAYPNSPSQRPAFLPSLAGKLVCPTSGAAFSPQDTLLLQVQELYKRERLLGRSLQETHLELRALGNKCDELEEQLRRYQNLPFMKTLRWLRRKILRLPEPAS